MLIFFNFIENQNRRAPVRSAGERRHDRPRITRWGNRTGRPAAARATGEHMAGARGDRTAGARGTGRRTGGRDGRRAGEGPAHGGTGRQVVSDR